MNTITGKTSTGFEFNYDKRILLDWDYITLLSVMTSEESSSSAKLEATQKIFYVLLGKEQTEALVKHVREYNDGFAPVEALVSEFKEIIEPKNL